MKGADNLIWGFSRRVHGNMSLSYGDTSASLGSREKFLAGLGIDYRDLVSAKQIHSANVRYVSQEDKGKGAESYDTALADTDALVTDKKNLPLAIFTADCLSIFLFDPETPAIGLAHAGWRSSKENIACRTLELMQKEFKTQAKNLRVSFGPAIRSCCYEVAEDLGGFFPDDLIRRDERYYLDLAKINLRQLLEAGVRQDNILDSGLCTSCRHEETFSFRREGSSCGRMMSVIMLK